MKQTSILPFKCSHVILLTYNAKSLFTALFPLKIFLLCACFVHFPVPFKTFIIHLLALVSHFRYVTFLNGYFFTQQSVYNAWIAK